jgi:restriction endonuclease
MRKPGCPFFKTTMTEHESELLWRVYERVVAAFEAEKRGMESSVTPNAWLVAAISHVERQIDVLIDLRWGDDEIADRTIVDAKNYAAKIDVKDVESFESMMKDGRAVRGILVCPNGYSPAAERRAQDAITIKLLTRSEVDEFDWAQYDVCLGECGGCPTLRFLRVGFDDRVLLGVLPNS